MTTSSRQSINLAQKIADQLGEAIAGVEISADVRPRVAAASFYVAILHHVSIVGLFDLGLFPSALALARPTFEAYVRGAWLAHCASDEQIAKYVKGKEPQKFGRMIYDLSKPDVLDSRALHSVLRANWGAMSDYAHTGIGQVTLVIGKGVIGAECPSRLVEEILGHAGAVAILASIGIAGLANDLEKQAAILSLAPAFTEQHREFAFRK